MKILLELPKCSKEMFEEFSSHLEQYNLSLGNVLEEFIFAMDCSNRYYARDQDEAQLAEGFFDKAVLNNNGMNSSDYSDFFYYGEVFNPDFLKRIENKTLPRALPECTCKILKGKLTWSERELNDIRALIPLLSEILRISLNISIRFDEMGEKLVLIDNCGRPLREINISGLTPIYVLRFLFSKRE